MLLLYAPPFWNAYIFTKLIILRSEVSSDWPAIQCIVIGRIPQAGNGNVMPLTVLWWCVTAQWHETIKPIINEAFVAFSADIITDNDLYLLFTRCVASHKHYHVCICDQRNNKQQALLYTAQNSHLTLAVANSLNMKTYLQAVSQKCQTVLAKL